MSAINAPRMLIIAPIFIEAITEAPSTYGRLHQIKKPFLI
jgi:hypothetical protein